MVSTGQQAVISGPCLNRAVPCRTHAGPCHAVRLAIYRPDQSLVPTNLGFYMFHFLAVELEKADQRLSCYIFSLKSTVFSLYENNTICLGIYALAVSR